MQNWAKLDIKLTLTSDITHFPLFILLTCTRSEAHLMPTQNKKTKALVTDMADIITVPKHYTI
jgi:hypothetical protein